MEVPDHFVDTHVTGLNKYLNLFREVIERCDVIFRITSFQRRLRNRFVDHRLCRYKLWTVLLCLVLEILLFISFTFKFVCLLSTFMCFLLFKLCIYYYVTILLMQRRVR